jgi:hypothetical protein
LPGSFIKTVQGKGDNPDTTTPDMDTALRYADLAAKRERDIMMGMGILPSHSQSIVIQQIYNDNRQTLLDPAILAALGGHLSAPSGAPSLMLDANVIDIEGCDISGEDVEIEGGAE